MQEHGAGAWCWGCITLCNTRWGTPIVQSLVWSYHRLGVTSYDEMAAICFGSRCPPLGAAVGGPA